MRKKIVGFFIFLAKAMCFVLSFCYIAGIVLFFLKDILPNNVAENIIYLIVGESVLPIDCLITKSSGFDGSGFGFLLGVLSIVVVVISAVSIFNLSKLKDKKETKKRHITSSILSLGLIFILFGFSLIYTIINQKQIANSLKYIEVDFVANLTKAFGTNALVLKALIAQSIIIFLSLLGIIAALLAIKRKKKEKTYISESSIIFYTSEYEEKVKTNEPKIASENSKHENPANMPEQSEKGKELVAKIMKLNQMKDEGQLTPKEYTRLRQKLIRKYRP